MAMRQQKIPPYWKLKLDLNVILQSRDASDDMSEVITAIREKLGLAVNDTAGDSKYIELEVDIYKHPERYRIDVINLQKEINTDLRFLMLKFKKYDDKYQNEKMAERERLAELKKQEKARQLKEDKESHFQAVDNLDLEKSTENEINTFLGKTAKNNDAFANDLLKFINECGVKIDESINMVNDDGNDIGPKPKFKIVEQELKKLEELRMQKENINRKNKNKIKPGRSGVDRNRQVYLNRASEYKRQDELKMQLDRLNVAFAKFREDMQTLQPDPAVLNTLITGKLAKNYYEYLQDQQELANECHTTFNNVMNTITPSSQKTQKCNSVKNIKDGMNKALRIEGSKVAAKIARLAWEKPTLDTSQKKILFQHTQKVSANKSALAKEYCKKLFAAYSSKAPQQQITQVFNKGKKNLTAQDKRTFAFLNKKFKNISWQ